MNRRDFLKKSAGTLGLFAGLAAIPLLGRKAAGQAAHIVPGEKKPRAWVMVIDLKKCEGCVTIGTGPGCTEACIAGHFSPKGQQWIEVYQSDLPGGGTYFLPTPCYQCENAPC